jgi:hypothetical protein
MKRFQIAAFLILLLLLTSSAFAMWGRGMGTGAGGSPPPPPPPPPPSGGCHSGSCMLFGIVNGWNAVPGFCRMMGICAASTDDGGYFPFPSFPNYPVNVSYNADHGRGSDCDFAALSYTQLTNGSCDATWTSDDNTIIAQARPGLVRVITVLEEWSGQDHSWGTNCTSNCPTDYGQINSNPSLFSNMWRHRVQLMRSNFAAAGVPAPPIMIGLPNQADEAKWNFDDLVDMVGQHFYMLHFSYSTSDAMWSDPSNCGAVNPPCASGSPFAHIINFANAHNKPIYFGEWGDCWPDADGSLITKMAHWMWDMDVAGGDYWNGSGGLPAPNDCSIDLTPGKLAAFKSLFGVPYTGSSFWGGRSWANWGTNPFTGGGQLPGCPPGVNSVSGGCGSGNTWW